MNMKASVTVIPIHGGMFLSITDVPDGNVTKGRIKNIRDIFKGCDFAEIQRLLKLSNYGDRVSVGMVQKTA